jgi:hypothetical protein
MGYECGKIYRLICDDGHYYYGSTIQDLNKRLWHHHSSSKTMKSKVYSYINTVGWNRVKIELIEKFPCQNRRELRIKENEYIQKDKNNDLCLNTLNAYTGEDEKKIMEKERKIRNKDYRLKTLNDYYEKNKEEINKKRRDFYQENKEIIKLKNKEYQKKNRDNIKNQRKLYYEENKEKICKEKKEHREANREETIRKRKEYREKNKERINEQKRIAYSKKLGISLEGNKPVD